MNTIKPILLVLAGVMITIAMFAFKMEEPKREYLFLTTADIYATEILIIYPDGTEKKVQTKTKLYTRDLHKVINQLASEGWILDQGTYTMMYRIKQ